MKQFFIDLIKVLLFESLVLIFDVENFGFEFLKNRTRIEPVQTPYLSRINPYLYAETLGLPGKPRVCPTRVEPVLTPYFTHTTPYLNMGSKVAPTTSFWAAFWMINLIILHENFRRQQVFLQPVHCTYKGIHPNNSISIRS